jgi:hypothetical protein
MHKEVQGFCQNVKYAFPELFVEPTVIDFGSYDINGNNRSLFQNPIYIGVDIHPGKNVDVVCLAHEFNTMMQVDIVISTEMLEHDAHWKESVVRMFETVKENGLVIITCATTGRAEHGTRKSHPRDSPATLDYYKNVKQSEFEKIAKKYSDSYQFFIDSSRGDLYFYAIKNLQK